MIRRAVIIAYVITDVITMTDISYVSFQKLTKRLKDTIVESTFIVHKHQMMMIVIVTIVVDYDALVVVLVLLSCY